MVWLLWSHNWWSFNVQQITWLLPFRRATVGWLEGENWFEQIIVVLFEVLSFTIAGKCEPKNQTNVKNWTNLKVSKKKTNLYSVPEYESCVLSEKTSRKR